MSYEATLNAHYREVRKRLNPKPPPPVPEPEPPPEPESNVPQQSPPPNLKSLNQRLRWAIYEVVFEQTGINRHGVESVRRMKPLVDARSLVCLLALRMKIMPSQHAISRMVGGRDNSSVLNLIRRAERQCAADLDYAAMVERLETRAREIAGGSV